MKYWSFRPDLVTEELRKGLWDSVAAEGRRWTWVGVFDEEEEEDEGVLESMKTIFCLNASQGSLLLMHWPQEGC